MPINQSHAGTAHIRQLADKALEITAGVTIELESEADAIRVRMQFNNLRAQDRRFNKKLYNFDDPRYGVSVYDSIETKILKAGEKYHLILRTVFGTLSQMKIIDNDTGQVIKAEDLI